VEEGFGYLMKGHHTTSCLEIFQAKKSGGGKGSLGMEGTWKKEGTGAS